MDPECLSDDELAYELRIRGFPPVITRHRKITLRDRLIMESRNETMGPAISKNIDATMEIEICANKLDELERDFMQVIEVGSGSILNALPSRFIHLSTRVDRINTDDRAMLALIMQMAKKIRHYLDLLFKAREGTINLQDHFRKSSCNLSTLSSSTEKDKDQNVSLPKTTATPVHTGTIPIPPGAHLLPLPSDQLPNNNLKPVEDPINQSEPVDNLSDLLNQFNFNSNSVSRPSNQQIAAPQVASINTNLKNKSTNPIRPNNNRYQLQNLPEVQNIPRNQNFQPPQYNYVPYYNPPIFNQPFCNYNYNQNQRPNQREYGYQDRNINYDRPQYNQPNYNNPYAFDYERLYQPRVEDYEVQEQPNQRNNRSNILGWKLTFTGEGGISLHDFLIQIPLMARADRISENTLLASAIHLFGGSAREWYIAFQNSFYTWGELVAALREQFLPEDSDYILLKKIESRNQQRNERFVLYLANMLNMFSHLRNEIPEVQKIAIIKRNMLPYLADRLALTNIETLNQLSALCRKVESIHSSRNIGNFEYPTQNVPQKPKPRQFNNFELNEIPNFNNVAAVNNNQNNNSRQHPQNGDPRCWNCHNEGHDYTGCNLKRLRVFCYRCGELGQASPTCLRCHSNPKNTDGGAERQEVRLLSREY